MAKFETRCEGGVSKPRKELWKIPETLFKEAIINSLAHRNYYDKGGRITIELFDDKVEINNPGALVNVITRNEFRKRSLIRNPLISGLFERMRMVEQIGSGIRMHDLMKEKGLTPPEFNIDGMFTVTFRKPFDFDKRVNLLSENRMKILVVLHTNLDIKNSELEQIVRLINSLKS
ncbi:ATP-binding protein [Flavobacterium sp. ZT3R25]|uniref:ATP-binding protein n=1 Tax=Flavobacterium galactosi TaxID=3398735 RepID=UPI003A83BDDF